MIRKTAFLITGTVAGVAGVVSYNPPQLNASISSAGITAQPLSSTTPDTQTQSKNSLAQPTPKASANKKTSAKSNKTNSQAQDKTPTQSTDTTGNSTVQDSTTSPTPTPTKKQSSGVSGTFKGDTSQTRWGPVQVEVILTDGKITDVKTLQYPNGDRRSLNISNQVIPWLQQETLRIQSAAISGISGATYTSVGFRSSLASALQKAGL